MALCIEWKPVVAMLAVTVALGSMNILIKKSLDDGLDSMVLVTMRQLTATLFLGPIAFFRERKSRPKMTWSVSMYIFISALFGASLAQYLFFLGLRNTSATFACAFLNMAPVFTFLVALPLRLETVKLRTASGKAKVLATLICVAGAVVLMLYKGPPLTHLSRVHSQAEAQATARQYRHTAPAPSPSLSHPMDQASAQRHWTLGSITLLCGCLCWSAWFLVQSKLAVAYPPLYSGTALVFLASFLQAAALTFATQGRGGASMRLWGKVFGKMELMTVTYAGVVGSGMGFLTMSWCVSVRGPVFTSAFSPLIQVFVAFIDLTVLKEPLYLGSVFGSVLVISGLYALLWAKSVEARTGAMKPAELANVIGEAKQPMPV